MSLMRVCRVACRAVCSDGDRARNVCFNRRLQHGHPDLRPVRQHPGERASCSSQTLAYASHCQLDQYDRPVFGFIQMCAARTDPKQRQSERDEDFHTALHEVTHILGFSEMLFPFFRNSNLQPRTPRCPLSYSPKMPAESSYKGELFLWYTNPQPRPQGWVHPPGWCCASNTFGEPPFRCEAQETLY